MSEPTPFEAAPPESAAPQTVHRWVGADQVIGTALVALMISLFLPWFSLTARISHVGIVDRGGHDGLQAHQYLWVVLVLAIIGLAVLIGRDAVQRVPGNLPSPGQMLVGTSLLAFVLTVLAVVGKPAGTTITGPQASGIGILGPHSTETISITWSYGGFVALVAAAVALIAAFITAGPRYEASRAAQQADPATG